MPPGPARCAILCNTLVLVMTAFSLVLSAVALHRSAVAVTDPRAVLTLVLPPLFLGALLFARLRLHLLAGLWFGLTAATSLLYQTVLYGRASGFQYFILVHAVGPFLLIPPGHKRWYVGQLGLYFLSFLAATLWIPDHPLLTMSTRDLHAMYAFNISGVFLAVAAFAYYERTVVTAAEQQAESERQRAEALLLNVLPAEIAARLKHDQRCIADGFTEVTVLFADLAGFTRLAQDMPPAQVVALLNDVFSQFDTLAELHGLEKIKTIGDAYMVAAGLPRPRPEHAQAMANMALDMLRVVAEFLPPDGQRLGMRIGIHSGPVVAGVIGKKKFTYDLWGDTVNVASRMESHGEVGAIQVTQATYERLGPGYVLQARGSIEVKGKGEMATWWLRGRKIPAGSAAPA